MVEQRDNPALKGTLFAVGSTGMLLTASYPSRAFGCRGAMPGHTALKLCPDLRIIRPRMDKYREAAMSVREVLARYDADFHSGGWDEEIVKEL